MGNVIGVDCSYASKQLLDKLFVTITFENKDSGKVIDALIAKHTFFNGCETGNSPVLNGDRTFRLLTVAARDVDSAAHILSQYRQTIKRIVFCGNPPITLLSTLESLLPNAVISECDYETCLHLGKSMAISSKGAIFAVDDEGGLFESNEPLQNNKGHLHAAVHSNALYALYSPNKGEPRYVGHSVIGYSAIAAIFNMFLKRFDSMDPCRVFIPKIGEIASGGNSATCDMLVKNIYGGGCEAIGLPGDMLASSFGMLQKRTELWLENSSTSKNVQIPKHSVNNDDTQDQTLSNGTVKNESVPICDTLASTEHLSKRACTSAKGGENISPSENLKDVSLQFMYYQLFVSSLVKKTLRIVSSKY
ncbi:pantothenate kinase [Babesia ovis]|uniref:Pantothenate kinase n=1 Tax=Babesia ovis TaxID=5869 RepID=A0A9W5WUL5_BABOV|nr:pantothenate kinase [Babesia ovis]